MQAENENKSKLKTRRFGGLGSERGALGNFWGGVLNFGSVRQGCGEDRRVEVLLDRACGSSHEGPVGWESRAS